MANIHFTIQYKGGVGKSMISTINYQAFENYGYTVQGYDLDPANATFAGYKELNVKRIELLEYGNIDPRKFDDFFEEIHELDVDSNLQVVVDNGASSFYALLNYMKDVEMVERLEEVGHKVFFHTIVTGGQALDDTCEGLVDLVKIFGNKTKIIVWLNPFFGLIERDGKTFDEFEEYKKVEDSIYAVIQLPHGNKDLIGKDLEELFAKRLSFKVGSKNGNIATCSRISRWWRTILQLHSEANLI